MCETLVENPDTTVATIEQKESVAICVADITEDVQLVAENVEQMQVAQQQLASWFRNKMQTLGADLGEVEAELKIATENGWRVTLFKSQIRRLTARISFYEKCALASEAGYCLVPNMPCDLFAVRTAKEGVVTRFGIRDRNEAASHRSESPPAGSGEYVDDALAVRAVEYTTQNSDPSKPRVHHHWEYRPESFGPEIDFPMSICKPAVMSATARAMALKVFDELAVVDDAVQNPGVNQATAKVVRRGDPLVIGIIRDPRRTKYDDKRISFLIGWYVDTSVL